MEKTHINLLIYVENYMQHEKKMLMLRDFFLERLFTFNIIYMENSTVDFFFLRKFSEKDVRPSSEWRSQDINKYQGVS